MRLLTMADCCWYVSRFIILLLLKKQTSVTFGNDVKVIVMDRCIVILNKDTN